MDFRETDEQSMIRQLVRDFAEEVLAPTASQRDKSSDHLSKNGKNSAKWDSSP